MTRWLHIGRRRGGASVSWMGLHTTEALASVVLVAAGLLTAWVTHLVRQGEAPLRIPAEPVSLAGLPVRGSTQARVAVLEFADFQCPYCALFADKTLPLLDRAYFQKGLAFLALRESPLAIHSLARGAANLAECARQAGKFWELHDRLYAEFGQPAAAQLEPGHIVTIGESLGLSKGWLEGCSATSGAARVEEDMAAMRRLGVVGTPSFFIGRVLADRSLRVTDTLRGAQPVGAFRAAIDRALRQ
jgi:protein-disulfide isomerase